MGDRLDGKVCIITGSGGAIGRASAVLFAEQGATVVGCDISAEAGARTQAEVAALGGKMVSLHPCDLTLPEQCTALVDLALDRFGRIDVLFNNAGKTYFRWLDDEPSPEFWYRNINEELNLAFLLTRAAWPSLAGSAGTIINTASTAGWITSRGPGGVAHSAAKGAILAMTRQLAMEGRKHGIRANSVSPGTIVNERTAVMFEDPAWAKPILSRIMRGTPGQPHEIAAVALFLASDDSSFVNGADIVADGGMSIW
ncbi:MAG: oxidoreductase protein [Bradyrhizobium sp.]|nr:oxidoreductase protein [Bradyrhizobium sp.]